MIRSSRPAALAALLIPAALLASACGGGANDSDTFTAKGIIVFEDDPFCEEEGNEVVIMNAEGADLAFGNLDEGEDVSEKGKSQCMYSFEIPGVESGHKVYKMTVDGKEAPRNTEEELTSGIALTYG